MDKNSTVFGFIGTGNMGGALAQAARHTIEGSRILLANRSPEKALALSKALEARVSDNQEIAKEADFIVLGVKPQLMEEVLAQISPVLALRKSPFLLVTMATGLTIARIRELAGRSYPVIRIMPNTPVSIGAGMVQYACSENVADSDLQAFLGAFAWAGRFSSIPEFRMDAGSAVSACGPAFADIFLEAMADGGVACGLSREQAMELAAQMLLGTAKLALESGQHPAALKDAVCSPGGTTIQGVRRLEEAGFRGAVIDAVIASYERTLELSPTHP
nr:pyrroline-5-carboxylate reductase [uncultured Acetatifactor sp.]